MSNWWDGDVQQKEPSANDVLSNPGASNFGDAGNEGVWQGSYDSVPQSGYQPGNGGLDTNSIYADLAMSPGPTGAYGVPGLSMYDDPDGGASAHFTNSGEWLGNMKDLGTGAVQIALNLSPTTFARQAFSDATGTDWLGGFAGPGRDWRGNPTGGRAQQLANGIESIASPEVFQQSDGGGQLDNNGGQPNTTQNPSTGALAYGGGVVGKGKKWNLTDFTGGYGV